MKGYFSNKESYLYCFLSMQGSLCPGLRPGGLYRGERHVSVGAGLCPGVSG